MKIQLPIHRRRLALPLVAAAACVSLTMSALPAWADKNPVPTDTATEAITAIQDVVPEVLADAAPGTASGTHAIEYNTDISTVSVPHDPNEGALLTSPNGDVGLHFPFAEDATAEVTDEGLVAFDNQNSSVTVPVIREEGSLQVLTVIEGPEAPDRYAYDLTLSPGSSVTPADDGTILITDAEGSFAGLIMPAWAKDAAGAPVETWYEVTGSTVTQVVVHDSDTQYPVVADPWLGVTLFKNFNRTTYSGDYRYNGTVTAGGAIILSGGGGVGGHAAGMAVFNSNGWDEWKAKWSAITNKATLKQQYSCHVAAGVYGLPFTGEYNLERSRANRSNWVSGVLSHRCNW